MEAITNSRYYDRKENEPSSYPIFREMTRLTKSELTKILSCLSKNIHRQNSSCERNLINQDFPLVNSIGKITTFSYYPCQLKNLIPFKKKLNGKAQECSYSRK